MTSPTVVPPERDRRKTRRVSFEPLRIRLDGIRDGILVDLSEGGALLQVSGALPQDRHFPVEIEWKNTKVPLQARVVRSVQRHVELESATLARMEYHVALEFVEMTRAQSDAVKRIIQGN
jgi:c-di-GMP-binding flagellar brake protein YcgR